MLSFREGTFGTPTAARAMAEHLREQTMPAAVAAMARYYARGHEAVDETNSTIAEPRRDLHPAVAEVLGISAHRAVSHEEMVNLLRGLRADGEVLPGRMRSASYTDRDRITYYDFCFSAPKSASIAFALAKTEAERYAIMALHREAVAYGMEQIETLLGHARRGPQGRHGSTPGRIGCVMFDHYTARATYHVPFAEADGTKTTLITTVKAQSEKVPGDMDVHTHCATPNVVVCDDGHVGSLDTAALHEVVKEVGGIYQFHYAEGLRRLGIATDLDEENGAFRVTAIPRAMDDLFSKRTNDGERRAREYVAAEGLDWDSLHPLDLVKILKGSTKAAREFASDDIAHFESWEAQARTAGYEHPSTLRTTLPHEVMPREERVTRATDAALPYLEQALTRRSVVPASEARIAATKGLIAAGSQDAADINLVTRLMRERGVRYQGEDVALIWAQAPSARPDDTIANGTGRRRRYKITTTKHVEHEREILAIAQTAAADHSKDVEAAALDRAVRVVAARDGLDFESEHGRAQREVMGALTSSGRFAVAIGVAGAGKTTLLRPMVEAWQTEATPRRIYGVALARNQAARLTEAGIKPRDAMPVWALLKRAEQESIRLDRNSVVVIDEFSQIATLQLLALARLQDRHGFSIVAIGDTRQGQPVEAGNSIALLQRALTKEAVRELLSSVRQIRERDRETALLFRAGRASDAIARLREDGHAVLVQGGRKELIQAAAQLWQELTDKNAEREGCTIGIAAPTNLAAREIAAAIRDRKRGRRALGPDLAVLPATDQEHDYDLPVAAGDRVRLFNLVKATYEDGTVGNFGDNRSVATVVRLEPGEDGGIWMTNKHGNTGLVRWSSLRDPGNGRIRLSYGDAVTIDAAQGDTTTDFLHVLPGGSKESHTFRAYPAQSRARETTHLLASQGLEYEEVINKRALGSARPVDDDAAWANVAANLSREPEKELALDLLDYATTLHVGTVDRFARAHIPREEAAARAGATAPGQGFQAEIGDPLRSSKTWGTVVRRLRRKRLSSPGHEEQRQAVRERRSMRAPGARPKATPQEQSPVPASAATQARRRRAPDTSPRPANQASLPAQAKAAARPSPRSAPPQKVISAADAQAQFIAALEAAGLRLEKALRTDGEAVRVPVLGAKRGRRSGLYRYRAGAQPEGLIVNFQTSKRTRWPASRVATREMTPEERAKEAAREAAARAQRESERAMKEDAAAAKALGLWTRSRPAHPDHGYLKAKGIGPHGMREAPAGTKIETKNAEGRIREKNISGWIVLPRQDTAGKVWSYQAVSPGGDKLYQLGGRVKGTFAMLGEWQEGQPLTFAEGFATAASVREATSLPVAITFDGGNLMDAARALRQRDALAAFVFAADNDHTLPRRLDPLPNVGVERADRAAAEVGGTVVVPRFGDLEEGNVLPSVKYPTDWNDYAARNGLAAVRAQFEAALVPKGITLPERPTPEWTAAQQAKRQAYEQGRRQHTQAWLASDAAGGAPQAKPPTTQAQRDAARERFTRTASQGSQAAEAARAASQSQQAASSQGQAPVAG